MKFRRVIYPALPMLSVGTASSQEALRYRYQFYDEDKGRIDVESHYLDYQFSWGEWGETSAKAFQMALRRIDPPTDETCSDSPQSAL